MPYSMTYREENKRFWKQLTIYCPWGEHVAHRSEKAELKCYEKYVRRAKAQREVIL